MHGPEITEATVTIPLSEYKQLMQDSLKLEALENGGVDNWTWYDEAMNEYRQLLEDWKKRELF